MQKYFSFKWEFFKLQMNSIASENCFLSWKYLSPSALEVIYLFVENCMSLLTFHFSSGFKSNEFRQLYNLLLARELLWIFSLIVANLKVSENS